LTFAGIPAQRGREKHPARKDKLLPLSWPPSSRRDIASAAFKRRRGWWRFPGVISFFLGEIHRLVTLIKSK